MEIGDTNFRPDDQQAVGGERIAEGAKPVAVELGAYRMTVAE